MLNKLLSFECFYENEKNVIAVTKLLRKNVIVITFFLEIM